MSPLDDRRASRSGGPDDAARDVTAPAGSERRLVSVLFADLVGFTSLAEGRDAEVVRELLDHYYQRARQVVARYGGTVEKFIGDAVMAVWGTPVANEDDAERAVRAALDLVAEPDLFGLGGDGAVVQLRAGVATGEAAVTIGATGEALVAGDLVNTASRLQSVAPPGTVLASDATYRAASAAIAFEPAGEQALKGKVQAVATYRPLRVIAERGGRGRAEGLEPPFVGREAELRLIRELFHATSREGRARLVSIIGQAGIGKSRLAWEFSKYIDGLQETVYWHHGRSPAYGEGLAFWALGEMVRERAGLAQGDDASATRARVAATLAEYVADEGERRWLEPRLLQLLGTDPGIGASEELFAAWRTFFERIAERGPVVMVFEDLHAADPGLLDFIEHLLEWARNRPIYILTLSRPELLDRRATWGAGQRSFTSLALDPLTSDAMRALLNGLVPGLSESTARLILDRAEGIPLYAVEMVRMLIHDGRLEAVGDVFRPVGDLTTLDIPDTLRALVAARLDRLDVADRRLLQDASVVGQTFTVGALAAVAGVDEEGLDAQLRGLVRRELLVLDADPRSPERGQYGFVQSVIREVAYSTLGRRERRARHLAAARYLERLDDDEIAGALASHYVSAYQAAPEGAEGEAVAVQARLALRGAADRAAALGSHEQALGYLREALGLLPERMETADRAALRERATEEAMTVGESDLALQLATTAADDYRSAGDRDGLTRSIVLTAMAHIDRAHITDGQRLLEAAVAERPEMESAADVALVAQLARTYMMNDDPRAIDFVDRALVAAERMELLALLPEALTTKAAAFSSAGRNREAWVLARGALDLARTAGSISTQIRAANNLAAVSFVDDPHVSYTEARAGVELARKLGMKEWAASIADPAIEGAIIVGEWDWATGIADEILGWNLASASTLGIDQTIAIVLVNRGRWDEARERLERTGPAVASGDRLAYVAAHHWIWGELLALEGRTEEGFDRLMAATEITNEFAAFSAYSAARVAGWIEDQTSFERARRVMVEASGRGRWTTAARVTVDARGAAFEGRQSDAIRLYEESDRLWRDLDLDWDRALALLDRLCAFGPDGPDAAAIATTIRSTFEQLGARGWMPILERALRQPSARVESGADAGRSDSLAGAPLP